MRWLAPAVLAWGWQKEPPPEKPAPPPVPRPLPPSDAAMPVDAAAPDADMHVEVTAALPDFGCIGWSPSRKVAACVVGQRGWNLGVASEMTLVFVPGRADLPSV